MDSEPTLLDDCRPVSIPSCRCGAGTHLSAMLTSLAAYIEPRKSAGYAPGASGAGSTI